MLQGWSAQWAELWALAQELRQTEGKRVNIYTDSSYAFATLHVHETIYKERGLLTAGGGERRLKKKESFQLLEAVWKWQSSIVKAIRKELIQSAKEIGWLIRQPRMW